MGKARTEHPEDPFNEFLKVLNMGSISSRKHETEFLYFQVDELEHLKDILFSIKGT